MASKPVTWMIPVLNGIQYLPYTLESIRRQTFQDFDVVIWDNGSTDGTVEELRKWIPGRMPGKIVTERPLPLGLSRAAMVCECETEFGALVDCDDVNKSDRLEKQIEFFRQNPSIDVLGTQINRLDSDGTDRGLFSSYPLTHEQIVQEMLVSNPIAQPSVIFRTSSILKAGNFSDVKVEDYDLWLRGAAAGIRFANLPESLVGYRIHPTSTTQKQVAANQLHQYMMEHLKSAAPSLFGCDGATIESLRERKHPHAITPLRQIADKLGSDAWKSPVFYNAARGMIDSRDLKSRIGAAFENRGISGAAFELNSIARSMGHKMFSSAKRSVVITES